MKLNIFNYTFIILIISALVVAYYFSLNREYYFFQQDAEVDYFINSFLVALGKKPESFHHPGLILQYFGGLIFYTFFSTEIINTQTFINTMKYILFLLNILILSLSFLIIKNDKTKISLLIIILFCFPSFLYYLDYFTVDTLILPISTILFLQTIKILSIKNNNYELIVLSIITSFALSLKFIFLPFFLIIIFCIFVKNIQNIYLTKKFEFQKSFIFYLFFSILFFLIINFSITEKLPYLFLNTLSEILSSFLSFKFLFLFVFLIIIFIFAFYLLYKYKFIFIKNIFLNKLLSNYLFILIGIIFLIINSIKINFNDFYILGKDTRHLSAYFVFLIYPLIFFTNKKYLIFILSTILIINFIFITNFVSDRNNWIKNNININLILTKYIQDNLNEDKNILIWTGSGNNNYVKETFFMWGDYRYNREFLNKKFSNIFPKVRMLRLRTLLDNNIHKKHNKSLNIIEKLSRYKIIYNQTTEITYGTKIDLNNTIFIVKKDEIKNEIGYIDEKKQFTKFLEDKITKKYNTTEINYLDKVFYIFK